MKKIYLFSILVLGFVVTGLAQPWPSTPDCPQTLDVRYYEVPLSPNLCKLYISGGPGMDALGNSPVVYLIGEDDQPFKDLHDSLENRLDPDGGTSITYDCRYIKRIEIIWWKAPGVPGECWYTPAEGGALPVKLTSFNGRMQNDNSVTLDWTSAIEENSFTYEVQRSVDGRHFETVGTLKAAGTSMQSINYTFDDQLPSAGIYFYRLKQIDIDGKFEYSKIVYVNNRKGSGVVTKLFPNPTKGEIQLIGATSADLQPNNLSIFSIAGQRIKYQVNGNIIHLDPATPDGVYIVRLKTAAGLQQFKVVKSQSVKAF
jgi:hypothetical protein